MGMNEVQDFMKPKAVSIRRKVKTTLISTEKREVEIKPVESFESLVRAVPVNPFRKSLKRSREDDPEETENEPQPKKDTPSKDEVFHITLKTVVAAIDPQVEIEEEQVAEIPLPKMPIDWCLKTKVRFSSTKQLPWSGILKTSEEASGTTGCVRTLFDQHDTSVQAKFHQNCLYWQHPSLPWVPLFPRQGQKRFEGSQLVDSRFHQALQTDFRQSFKSLYQLLRARQCAYFYVCGPDFTVLYRATGVGGFNDIHALVSPTTKGLRNTLKEKGIDFQMPFRNEERVEGDVKEDTNDDDDDQFFESLGLSQEDYPNIAANKQQKAAFNPDVGPSSCVVVIANAAQALFNHLLNTDLSITVGSQAGIPPTLLSPVAFHGATLRSQKVRQTWYKNPGSDEKFHAIEMVGPLMPHAIDSMCNLFSQTQEDFSLVTTPTTGSVAFSRTINQGLDTNAPVAFAVESLKDCGLPEEFIQRICSSGSMESPLVDASFKDGSFFVKNS